MAERWQHELRKLRTLEPPAGLWDRIMLGSRRQPPRAHKAWQVIAPVAAALAVVLIAGGLALAGAFAPRAVRPGSPAPGPGRFVDPRFGWTIRYPRGMQAGYFQSRGMFTSDGVRVTSFPPSLQAPSSGAPPMGWLRTFPADGVALQIWFGERVPAPPPLRDSALPLPPASFTQVTPYVGGSEPIPRYRSFYADGFDFSAAVWVGPHASRAEQQAIWAVVRSLSFPSLHGGTVWHGRYFVLGAASRYRTGSVTTFPSGSLPRGLFPKPAGFYLIHAPRAFYVINQLFQNPVKPSAKCPVAFDPKVFQFFCPGTDLRWDRIGQPVGPNARRGSEWALPLHVATLAQDGHILFSPFYGWQLQNDLQGSPWR